MKRIKLILPDLSLLAIWNFEKQIWDFRDNKMLHITKMATICILRINENLALPLFWYFVWPQKLCLDLYWSHLSFYLIQEKKNRKCFLSSSLKEGGDEKGKRDRKRGEKRRKRQLVATAPDWSLRLGSGRGGQPATFYAQIFPWFHPSSLFRSKVWPKTG